MLWILQPQQLLLQEHVVVLLGLGTLNYVNVVSCRVTVIVSAKGTEVEEEAE
jgi:hypothetical protein